MRVWDRWTAAQPSILRARGYAVIAVARKMLVFRWGVSVYFGPGYVVHWSTEDGWEFARAEHRTWRLGILVAVR